MKNGAASSNGQSTCAEERNSSRAALLTPSDTERALRDASTIVNITKRPQFSSEPRPPHSLWDTEDVQFLDKVKCHIYLRITRIDPKNGKYEGRMKCHWELRTLNTKERTEPRIRVPGIRTPRLCCAVEESRIWRHYDGDSEKTINWKGISVIAFSGHEIFEVHDFPFDRQIVNLDLFDFVWRNNKDADVYHEAMKVVYLRIETISMLPEWDTFSAIIEPRNVWRPGSGPSFGTRFEVRLRLQRREKYYITQIFLISFLITSCSLLPLALAPGDKFIGDRLALHSSGLLTLISFKYGVQGDMPSVPYSTFVSTFLTAQICTLVAVSAEAIVSYRLVDVHIGFAMVNLFEDVLLYFLLMGWLMYFLYFAFNKARVPWDQVLSSQEDNHEVEAEANHNHISA